MEEKRTMRLGVELAVIHQCISRAIQVSRQYGGIFRQSGFPEPGTGPGFADYVRSLLSVLHAHHLGEDEVVFPIFREILPEAPYARLSAEHLLIRPLLVEIRIRIDQALVEGSSLDALARLDRLVAELEEIWRPHIETEETHFFADKIDAAMPPDDQARTIDRLGRFFQEHSGPDYLIVPFTLFNLAPESRSILSETLPRVVTQTLVPGARKERWQPMAPFLLV
jgi:hemerythrin superfamily protein